MKTEENIALIKQQLSDFKIDLGSIKELLDVNVTTAKRLSAAEYQSISVILTEKLGREIFLNKKVDPSILGGIIVQVGDKVFDASALRKLKKMEVALNGIDVHEYTKPEAWVMLSATNWRITMWMLIWKKFADRCWSRWKAPEKSVTSSCG